MTIRDPVVMIGCDARTLSLSVIMLGHYLLSLDLPIDKGESSDWDIFMMMAVKMIYTWWKKLEIQVMN